jgi:hypothetical protein
MYFPYLRGKQYELLAIRELAPIIDTDKIIPIIEPVKSNISSLRTALEVMQRNKFRSQIILNPSVGDFKSNNTILEEFIRNAVFAGNSDVIPAFIIANDRDFEQARNIISQRNYDQSGYSLIHLNKVNNIDALTNYLSTSNCLYNTVQYAHLFSMRRKLGGTVSMLNDYFNKLPRNTEYIHSPFEVFSSDYKYYKDEGCIAFSDYQTIGKDYSEGGGAAYAVAIHLTFKDVGNEDIQIAHFVSDNNDGPEDPAGKFFEALSKLVQFVQLEGIDSLAIRKFKEYHNSQAYPGLGVVKKLSIINHIELMQSLI